MSLTFFDGFDRYPDIHTSSNGLQSLWSFQDAIAELRLAAGRFGGQCLYVAAPANPANAWRAIPSTTTLTVGVAVNVINITPAGLNCPVYCIQNGGYAGTSICGLGITNNQQYYLWVGSAPYVPIATATSPFVTPDAWHYLEVEYNIGTSGSITVFCDGVQIMTYSGNLGTTACDTLMVGTPRGETQAIGYQLDDLYVNNTTTRYGERRIVGLTVDADVLREWTPSVANAANNYSLIDTYPVPGSPSTFVFTSNVGGEDTYTVNPLPGAPSSITAVQVVSCASKDDPSVRQMATILNSGGSIRQGNTFTLAASYLYTIDVYENDPNTGSAWTANAVNAVVIGQKLVA